MTQELLPTVSESDTHEIVYRNKAVALFDEDEFERFLHEGGTRVFRYDRSSWAAEIYHRFEPDRSTGGELKISDGMLPRTASPKPPRKERCSDVDGRTIRKKAPMPKHTVESLSALKQHGDYVLDRVIVTPGGGHRVIAYCIGGHCNKTMRSFGAYHWLTLGECMRCPKCHRAKQVQALRDATNPTHGLYRFLGFAERTDKNHGSKVIAQCTGPKCGGKLRYFSHKQWQEGTEGLLGCLICSADERGKRARATVLDFGTETPLLDAAANEMRRMEGAA